MEAKRNKRYFFSSCAGIQHRNLKQQGIPFLALLLDAAGPLRMCLHSLAFCNLAPPLSSIKKTVTSPNKVNIFFFFFFSFFLCLPGYGIATFYGPGFWHKFPSRAFTGVCTVQCLLSATFWVSFLMYCIEQHFNSNIFFCCYSLWYTKC